LRPNRLPLDHSRDDDLLDGLTNLDQLCRAGDRMRLQLAPLGPVIRLVVMVDVTQQQTGGGLVNDQAKVPTRPHRPKIPVTRPLHAMETQTRTDRVQLQIEGRGLDQLLLVTGQTGEAGGKGVGYTKFHDSATSSFSKRTANTREYTRIHASETSSPLTLFRTLAAGVGLGHRFGHPTISGGDVGWGEERTPTLPGRDSVLVGVRSSPQPTPPTWPKR
jgi:hypothetical protein